MKALDIWQQDLTLREQGTPQPRQQYYTELRDALWQELMQQGYSDYLEQTLLDIRSGLMDRIYVLDYAALTECHSMIVLGREMRDASAFVPHLHLRGERAAWADVEGPGAFLMPITKEMTEQFRQLRAVSHQLVDARDSTVIPQAGDAAQREIEQVHTLNKMLDDRCQALQAERDELQSRLRMLEEGVITEQVRYAIEARRLQEEEALRLRREEQQQAAQAAFRAQYAREQAAAAARIETDEAALLALRAEAARDHDHIRRAMADSLDALLTPIRQQIGQWQSQLDRSECLMLARSYAALHETASAGMDALVLEAECTGAAPQAMDGLARMRAELQDRVRQLETAMLRLGLTVIRPQAGEAFRTEMHIPADAAFVPAGNAVITRCLTPGVAFPGAQEALLKAEVELS